MTPSRILALFAFLAFLLTAFRAGWTRPETDFQNYYTGAVLVRHSQPLRKFYNWTWFQREMNYAGLGKQLGSYTGQTPLTMLPIIPLAGMAAQNAKRVWLVCNLAFLWIAIWMLSRITRFRFDQIWLLAICGYFSLRMNFLYGQYYVFLLLLLTSCIYFLVKEHEPLSGIFAGLAFALKLYGGPLLLLFLAKRKWKAAAAMLAAVAVSAILAIKLFGWTGVHYYLAQVLPRSLEGNPINPYDPHSATLSNMLRHWFVFEPELNPHPLWNLPVVFFFLRTLITLGISGILFVGVAARPSTDRRDFAWFVVGTLLLSSSTGSYTFIVLLLPLVLLLEEATGWPRALFIACYIFMTLPLPFPRLFPKVWALLFFFVAIRWEQRRELFRPVVVACAALALIIAVSYTKLRMRDYDRGPGQNYERIAVREGALFSSFPVITRAGLFYQSLDANGYALRWLHEGRNDQLSFDGFAFRPVARGPDGPIDFELVSHGRSTMMELDTASGTAVPVSDPVPMQDAESVSSPDGKWIAFTPNAAGPAQIWLRNAETGAEKLVTGGKCNSYSPTWDLDSKSIVFASDCERGMGLTGLYRAPIR